MDETLTAVVKERIERLAELVRRARSALPGEPIPCFAHLRIRTERAERDVLVGPRTLLARDVTILDARTAPLARLVHAHDEGEDYEFDDGGRLLEGTLLEKTLLTLEGERIVGVRLRGKDLVRDDASGWSVVPRSGVLLRPEVERGQVHSPIDVQLDAVQRAAVTAAPGGASLVVGEAGAGKTTVALHRLAHLCRAAAARGEPHRALYLAPSEGLTRLVTQLVGRLSTPDIEVARLDAFAAELARRSLRRLPTRIDHDASAAVIRVKRQRSLDLAIDALLASDRGEGREARLASREDLLELFGDRERLSLAMTGSHGAVSPSDVEAVALHTRAQFESRTEDVYSDVVDAQKLETLDGRSIDAGTPDDAAGRIDAEDFVVLLEIAHRRAQAMGRTFELPRRFHTIAVDEAQELSPLELRLIGRALLPGGTLVVAGDDAQQIDDTACFEGFDVTLRDLGVASYDTIRLEVSYRCPANVDRLARTLRAEWAEESEVDLPALAPEVVLVECANDCHAAARIGELVREVRDVDSAASIAIICRDAKEARRWHAVLGPALEAPLALEGDFDFRARLHVTAVVEVKGLEFDYVILPDVTSLAYPPSAESRRALYVALTRASEQLVLMHVGARTALLPRGGW